MRTFILVFLLTFSIFVSAGPNGPDLASLLADYEGEQVAQDEENSDADPETTSESESGTPESEPLVEIVEDSRLDVSAEDEASRPVVTEDLISDEEIDLGEALEEIAAPLEVGVPIHQVTDEVIENTAQKVSALTEKDLVDSSVVIDGRLVTLLSLGGVHKHVHELTQSILTKLYADNDHSEIQIEFNSSPIPKVTINSWDENAKKIERYKILREKYYVRGTGSLKPVEIQSFKKLEAELTELLGPGLRPQPEATYQSRSRVKPRKKVRGRPEKPEGNVSPEKYAKYEKRLKRWEEAKAKRDAEEAAAKAEEEFQRKIRTRLDDEKLETIGERIIKSVNIAAGVVAHLENVDQFAAILAYSLAMDNPAVYGIIEDPKFRSELDKHREFTERNKEEQEIIKISVSVMERLHRAGYHPNALEDYERNVLEWMRKEFIDQKGYKLGRGKLMDSLKQMEEGALGINDPMRVPRHAIMSAYFLWLFQDTDMRGLKYHNFEGPIRKWVKANKILVKPLYSKWYGWAVPSGATTGLTYMGYEFFVGGLGAFVSNMGTSATAFIATKAGTIGEALVATGLLTSGNALTVGGITAAIAGVVSARALLVKNKDRILEALSKPKRLRINGGQRMARPRIPKFRAPKLSMPSFRLPKIQWRRNRTELEAPAERPQITYSENIRTEEPTQQQTPAQRPVVDRSYVYTPTPRQEVIEPEVVDTSSEVVDVVAEVVGEEHDLEVESRAVVPRRTTQVIVLSDLDPRPFLRNKSRQLFQGGMLVAQRTSTALAKRYSDSRDWTRRTGERIKNGLEEGTKYTVTTAVTVYDASVKGGKRLVVRTVEVSTNTLVGGYNLGRSGVIGAKNLTVSGVRLGTAVVVGGIVGTGHLLQAGGRGIQRFAIGTRDAGLRAIESGNRARIRTIEGTKKVGVAIVDYGASKTQATQAAWQKHAQIGKQRRRELRLLRTIGHKDPSQINRDDLRTLIGSARDYAKLHQDTPKRKNLPKPVVNEDALPAELSTIGLTSRSMRTYYVQLIKQLSRVIQAKVMTLEEAKEYLDSDKFNLKSTHLLDTLKMQMALNGLGEAMLASYPEIFDSEYEKAHIVSRGQFFHKLNRATKDSKVPELLQFIRDLEAMDLNKTAKVVRKKHFVSILKFALSKEAGEYRELATEIASEQIRRNGLASNFVKLRYNILRHLSPEEKIALYVGYKKFDGNSSPLHKSQSRVASILLKSKKSYDGVRYYLENEVKPRGVSANVVYSQVSGLNRPDVVNTYEDFKTLMELSSDDSRKPLTLSTIKKIVGILVREYKGRKMPVDLIQKYNDFLNISGLNEGKKYIIDSKTMDLFGEFYRIADESGFYRANYELGTMSSRQSSPLELGFIAHNIEHSPGNYDPKILDGLEYLQNKFFDTDYVIPIFRSWAFDILNSETSRGNQSSANNIRRFLSISNVMAKYIVKGRFLSDKATREIVSRLTFPQQVMLYHLTITNPILNLIEIKRPHVFFTKEQLRKFTKRVGRALVDDQRSFKESLGYWEREFETRAIGAESYVQDVLDRLSVNSTSGDKLNFKIKSNEDIYALQEFLFKGGFSQSSSETYLYYLRIIMNFFNESTNFKAQVNSVVDQASASQFAEQMNFATRFKKNEAHVIPISILSKVVESSELRKALAKWYRSLTSNDYLSKSADFMKEPTERDGIFLWTKMFYDIENMSETFDGKRLVEIFDTLVRYEKLDFLVGLYKTYGSRLADYIISTEASVKDRDSIFNTIKSITQGGLIDARAAEHIIVRNLNGDQRASWASMRRQYEFGDYRMDFADRVGAFFGGKRSTEKQAILTQIEKSPTVRGFSNYIKAKFKKTGGDPSYYDELMHDEVISRPKLFNTLADVMDFLAQDFYWPATDFDYTDENKWKPLERPFLQLLREKAKNPRANKGSWIYPPAFSEKAHGRLIGMLHSTGSYPSDLDKKFELWKALTNRGVTTFTDGILDELLEVVDDETRDEILNIAIDQDRIFDTKTRDEFAMDYVKETQDYIQLMDETDIDKRYELLKNVVSTLQDKMPDRGLRYEGFLENLSVDIMSNQQESTFIQSQKGFATQKSEAELAEDAVEEAITAGKSASSTNDLNVQILDQLIKRVEGWEPEEQFQFLRFLRGDRKEASAYLQAEFENIGPERIRHIYQNLPTEYKIGLMTLFMKETFLSNNRKSVDDEYPKKIVNEIIGSGNDQNTKVTRAILTAGLVALKESAIPSLQPNIFGNILAVEKGKKGSVGKTLRIVLEQGFGPIGSKIAQQIVALQVLDYEDALELMETQDNTGLLEREEQYRELRSILDAKGKFPFELHDFKGGASLKWAIKALWIPAKMAEGSENSEVILKILRKGAANFTRNRYPVLNQMVKYLIDNSGPEFSILRAIVDTARIGVERELKTNNEVENSKRAREFIYINLDDQESQVQVPEELLFPKTGGRLILSHFAEGESFHKLPEEVKPLVAKKILEMETGILFGDKDEVEYDPDRHAGNYRIWVKNYDGENHLVLEPIHYGVIDMGQLTKITRQERSNVIDLFALAQIYAKAGSNFWFDNKVAEMFDMDSETKLRFKKLIRRYFPSSTLTKAMAYYGLISAIYESGFDEKELKKAVSTDELKSSLNVSEAYFDFPRAIIQLMQYEPYIPSGVKSPSQILEEQVTDRINQYVDSFATENETMVKLRNGKEWAKSLFSREKFVAIKPGMNVRELTGENFEFSRELYERKNPGALTVVPASFATSCEASFFDYTPAIQSRSSN